MKHILISAIASSLLSPMDIVAQQHNFTVDTKPGVIIQPTMYGIFFEDINFGADGGLYAELIENRSFEFPNRLMGWETYGNVTVNDIKPAFNRNPHYVTLSSAGHDKKLTGIENHGFFGIGLKKDMTYDFTLYARLHNLQDKEAKIRIELVDEQNIPVDRRSITIENNKWKKYSVELKSNKTEAHGYLRIFLDGTESVDIDNVSLFPSDNWNGLRADLVKDLEDLHPGIFRFPGGCIVEGTDLETRYQWKNSVGPAENRPLNENRWSYSTKSRPYSNYYQTYGLGFYEYFLLSEKIGAEPLPVLSCGLACQFQNGDADKNAHLQINELQPYIDDALDLIEFANGDTTTKWGKLRSEMGHPKPFGLKQIAIGNEQWGEIYPERLKPFVEQIRARYPSIKICGSAGPKSDGKSFDYGWQEMRKLKVDLVDEHYYRQPDWFLNNAKRYDNYDRKGPKVFAGEYACHVKGISNDKPTVAMNNWETALSEAAFMTGFERNADIVWQCTYAPLFAHVDGWQWRPDLIWFDNLNSVRSINWYVQMLYATNKGTNILQLTENGKSVAGEDGLYASAVYDKPSKNMIIKIANASERAQKVTISFKGVKKLSPAQLITLHADDKLATNTLEHPHNVVPQESVIPTTGNNIMFTIPAMTFQVIKL